MKLHLFIIFCYPTLQFGVFEKISDSEAQQFFVGLIASDNTCVHIANTGRKQLKVFDIKAVDLSLDTKENIKRNYGSPIKNIYPTVNMSVNAVVIKFGSNNDFYMGCDPRPDSEKPYTPYAYDKTAAGYYWPTPTGPGTKIIPVRSYLSTDMMTSMRAGALSETFKTFDILKALDVFQGLLDNQYKCVPLWQAFVQQNVLEVTETRADLAMQNDLPTYRNSLPNATSRNLVITVGAAVYSHLVTNWDVYTIYGSQKTNMFYRGCTKVGETVTTPSNAYLESSAITQLLTDMWTYGSTSAAAPAPVSAAASTSTAAAAAAAAARNIAATFAAALK